jgi:hypothetical protein
MNTKFFFVLLVVVVLASACAPVIAGNLVPADPIQPVVPVTGESAPVAARSDSQAPRLWSGEIFLSDNNSPDNVQNIEAPAIQNSQSLCTPEDSQPRRYGGCVE